MNRTRPIWLAGPSSGSDAFGNSLASTDGATSPRSDGPSSTPATVSATTSGCPSLLAPTPSSRGTMTIRMACATRPRFAFGELALIARVRACSSLCVSSWRSPSTRTGA
jgi:hypothetical protein